MVEIVEKFNFLLFQERVDRFHHRSYFYLMVKAFLLQLVYEEDWINFVN